jgi:hypothetical protein
MTQGERELAVERSRLLHRQELRIRTVAVSFGAAVSSAAHDLDGSPAERDTVVEVWRAWSLDQLERYGTELDELQAEFPQLAEDIDGLRELLARSMDSVRRA